MIDRKTVAKEETERVLKARHLRLVDAMRNVMGTKDGQAVLGWLLYDAGGLMKLGNEGRREMAMALYAIMDEAKMGVAETIAVDERHQLSEDNLNIAHAISKRMGE